MTPHVLIAGVSTRAAAESAARAGYSVTSIDAYADLDQHPSVRALSTPGDFGTRFSATACARIARALECGAVAYLSTFENHPRAVSALASGRELWGNAPAVLRRVRDPFAVAEAFRRRGLCAPDVKATADAAIAANDWLQKPYASGGGRGVSRWVPGARLARRRYLQQRIDGTPGSLVFVAANGKALPIGFSRQLTGESAFGASAYRYCGSIVAPPDESRFIDDRRLLETACALADVVTREFGLVGVNGVDFVARDGVPFPIEVNPRWCSSMELVERAYRLSVFAAHAAACTRGVLPAFDLSQARARGDVLGKAIVFARRDTVVGNTAAWVNDTEVRDVPHPGDRIRAGQPICTVFAHAGSAAACELALAERARHVYEQVDVWRREAA